MLTHVITISVNLQPGDSVRVAMNDSEPGWRKFGARNFSLGQLLYPELRKRKQEHKEKGIEHAKVLKPPEVIHIGKRCKMQECVSYYAENYLSFQIQLHLK